MKTKSRMMSGIQLALGIAVLIALVAPEVAQAQIPPAVQAELIKMGHVVEPGCTGKLYRTLFGKNDYNMYWPVDAAAPNTKVKLYPGVTVMRDTSYGPQPKDLIDLFVPDKGGDNRTVFIFVPGGAGNKIEQQSVEANMFYDNIGKWAADSGMIGVTIQRGGTAAGQNIALVIEWLQNNVAKYKGNPADMFIMAHSAGTAPLAQYIGRPDLYGLGVKGAIFMGGNPNIGAGGGRGGGGGGAPAGGGAAAGGGRGAPQAGAAPAGAPAAGGAPAGAAPGGGGGGRGGGGFGGANASGVVGSSGCINTAGAGSGAGVIRGPSSSLPDNGAGAAAQRTALAATSPVRWDGKQWISTGTVAPPPTAAGGRGGGGGGAPAGAGGGGARGGGGAPAAPAAGGTAPAAPAFTNQDGFRSTRAMIALAWGEWDTDPAAEKGMPPNTVAIHDELCKLDGPKAKDGVGHCPTMMWFKGESHMSEVFSFGSSDKTVSDQVSAFIKKNR